MARPSTAPGVAPLASAPSAPLASAPIAGLQDPANAFTNINTTNLLADPGRFSPPPTAKFLDRINPDPLWITRWQSSATVKGERPWVKGFRWWEANVPFQSWGPDPLYRIDFLWEDASRGYRNIPEDIWRKFRDWTGSVGQFFHQYILVPNWRPGLGARYPEVPTE